jgi:hypothetical protein
MWCWQFGINDLAIRTWQEVRLATWQIGCDELGRRMWSWWTCNHLGHIPKQILRMSSSLNLFPQYAPMNFHFIGWGLTLRNSIHSNPLDGFTLIQEWTFMYMNGESWCAKVETPLLGIWAWNMCSLWYLKSMPTWKVQCRRVLGANSVLYVCLGEWQPAHA